MTKGNKLTVEHLLKVSFLLAAWLFLPIVVSGAEQVRDIWFFQGDSIPVSPQQNQFWQPPESDIPAEYIDTAATAFKHGLADPRNCEYLEVVVPVGNDAYGGFYRLKTHGWLLPRDDKYSQRFAILWNGLVYPVISIGSVASVQDDIQQLIAYAIQKKSAMPEQERVKFPEIFSLGTFHYGTVCALLLRLGETELAERIYHAAVRKSIRFWNDDVQKFTLWALFSRALAAHMYGDDKLALCYAKQYEPLIGDEKVEFVSTARELLAEQHRRAREKTVAKSEIDALILGLENVDERQYGQPGGVILGNDKRVKALIEVGDAAVEPLLECLENDRRLTRSVSFHRDFFPQRTIITVADAAYVALSGILQQSFFEARSTSDNMSNRDIEYRKKIAQQIREHYNRYKNMSYEDKWYHILLNNNEPVEAQLQAAANICRKSNVKVIPQSSAGFAAMTDPKATSVQLTGEALRSKTNPSVSELLNRRAVEYLPDDKAAASSWTFHNAQKMALFSSEWDLPNSLTALQEISNAIYRELPKSEYFKEDRLELLVPLTIWRVKAGDEAALRQYCEVLLANPEPVLGKNGGHAWEGYLEPLYTFSEDATVITTAEKIFNTSDNDWSKYFGEFKDARRIEGRLFAKFMRLAPYRKHVQKGLNDKTEILKWQTTVAGDRVNSRFEFLDGGGNGSNSFSLDDVKNDPLLSGSQSTQILRVCDVFAKALSALKDSGYPVFRYYWDEKARDRAIEKIAFRLSE